MMKREMANQKDGVFLGRAMFSLKSAAQSTARIILPTRNASVSADMAA
jgi:hypothetical protein